MEDFASMVDSVLDQLDNGVDSVVTALIEAQDVAAREGFDEYVQMLDVIIGYAKNEQFIDVERAVEDFLQVLEEDGVSFE